jgi:hypothetical protein
MPREKKIGVFAVLNFILAGFCLLGLVTMAFGLVYGVFLSGDQGEELWAGVLGCLMIMLPAALGLVVYTLAGIGLLKRKSWGFVCHVIGAALAVLSCIGVVYTVIALIFAFRRDFKDEFFALPSPPPPGARI